MKILRRLSDIICIPLILGCAQLITMWVMLKVLGIPMSSNIYMFTCCLGCSIAPAFVGSMLYWTKNRRRRELNNQIDELADKWARRARTRMEVWEKEFEDGTEDAKRTKPVLDSIVTTHLNCIEGLKGLKK